MIFVSGSPAQIVAGGQATVTVNVSLRPGSGALWVVGGSNHGSNTANGALSYHYTQLQQSTSTPAVQLHFPETPGGNIDASDVAVDKNGNLWVANDNSNSVVEYTPASLAASGTPTPAVTLQGPNLTSAYSLAFDSKGDLWVADINVGRIVELTPSQLTQSGSPTPAVTLGDSTYQTSPTGHSALRPVRSGWRSMGKAISGSRTRRAPSSSTASVSSPRPATRRLP